jgi:murein hydrolase activator
MKERGGSGMIHLLFFKVKQMMNIGLRAILIQRFAIMGIMVFAALVISAVPDLVDNKKKELATLRQQVENYEKELQKQNRDEAAELNLLANMDKEIDLTRAYVRTLRVDLDNLEAQEGRRGQEITGLSIERERLRSLIKERMIQFYKHKRSKEIELLLSVQTWDQLKAWIKYEKLIADNDRRNLQALQDRGRSLERQQDFMRIELSEKERRLQEKRREENNLQTSKNKRQTVLDNLQRNKKLVQIRLQEIRDSEKQISALIAKAEKARIAQKQQTMAGKEATQRQPTITTGHHFAELKGRMTWPTKGTVVSHFGRERHPELNTITENLGIEIKARLGSPVIAVDDGVVQTITWQRGRGNIIIISHEDGFYTVYTHLQDISVEEQQPVKQGQSIGSVGESGSLIGPVLHFQIWKNTVNLDPEEWLV